jgi:hypothetical protein
MASFASISAVGKSIERFLAAAFMATPPVADATVTLVRTEDFDATAQSNVVKPPCLTIFLYRVDFNKQVRASWSAIGSADGRGHLPLDLHFLLTAWASDAEKELLILGRALQAMESTPILSGPLLYASGGFAPNETVQVTLEDVTTEAVMRMFDSLPTDYKLSVPYVARVVRVDGLTATPGPPVLTVAIGSTPEVP